MTEPAAVRRAVGVALSGCESARAILRSVDPHSPEGIARAVADLSAAVGALTALFAQAEPVVVVAPEPVVVDVVEAPAAEPAPAAPVVESSPKPSKRRR